MLAVSCAASVANPEKISVAQIGREILSFIACPFILTILRCAARQYYSPHFILRTIEPSKMYQDPLPHRTAYAGKWRDSNFRSQLVYEPNRDRRNSQISKCLPG